MRRRSVRNGGCTGTAAWIRLPRLLWCNGMPLGQHLRGTVQVGRGGGTQRQRTSGTPQQSGVRRLAYWSVTLAVSPQTRLRAVASERASNASKFRLRPRQGFSRKKKGIRKPSKASGYTNVVGTASSPLSHPTKASRSRVSGSDLRSISSHCVISAHSIVLSVRTCGLTKPHLFFVAFSVRVCGLPDTSSPHKVIN